MKTAIRRALIGPLLLLVAALLAVVAATAPGARAAGGLDEAAAALQKGPVYVDPRVASQFSSAEADALAKKIKDADKPVFVAVLPRAAEYPPGTLLKDLRTKTGISGVYAVELGNGFNAGADPRVMPHSAVQNLVGSVQRSHYTDVGDRLNSFVDTALKSAHGHAPSSWGGSGGSGFDTGTAIGLGVLVVVGGGGAYAIARRTAGGGPRRSGRRWRICGSSSTRTSPPSARSWTGSTSTPASPVPTRRCARTTAMRWTRTRTPRRRWRRPSTPATSRA